MYGIHAGRRVFDPLQGLKIASGEVVLDAQKAVRARRHGSGRGGSAIASGRAAIFLERRDGSTAAAVRADAAAVVEDVRPGSDVDKTDSA